MGIEKVKEGMYEVWYKIKFFLFVFSIDFMKINKNYLKDKGFFCYNEVENWCREGR